MKRLLQFIAVLIFFASSIFAQNQTNMYWSGDMNSWGATSMIYRALGTPSWIVTVQATSGSAGSGFKFRNSNSDYNNAWSSQNLVSQSTLTTWTYVGSGGSNSTVGVTSGKYYTFVWQDVATGNGSQGFVMETSSLPVAITSVSQSPTAGSVSKYSSVTVTIGLSGSPSAEELFYVRYTTDNWSSSSLAQATGSGSTLTATIPGMRTGTPVSYYVFSTTVSDPTSDFDLLTISYSNNGGSNYSYSVNSPIIIDGDFSESQYSVAARKQNTNTGFGVASIDSILYYADTADSVLFVGMAGKLSTSSNDEIGIWLDVAGSGSPTGVAAGTALGGVSAGGGFIGDGTHPNYKADFEVDYQFGFNTGGSTTSAYFDAADMVGTPTAQYVGSTNQSGTAVAGPSSTGIFQGASIVWAYDGSGTEGKGIEIGLPFSEIGATSSHLFEIFTFEVSYTASFSNLTVPGNLSTTGYDVNFSTETGVPFHAGNGVTEIPLPVEMSSYSATYTADGVTLNWQTQTELNNAGFNVYRKVSSDASFALIASYKTDPALAGLGTSTTGKSYSFVDKKAVTGAVYDYKIESVNANGTTKDFGPIRVTATSPVPGAYALAQNYPNPFNPTTTISVDVKKTGYARLEIFNSLGEKVATLLNGTVRAGTQHFVWDASKLPSGIYFYRFTTDGFSAMKKMMMVK